MKILIIDRDDVAPQLIKSRLEPVGHEVVHEADKGQAADVAANTMFDLIFVDPSPLTDARAVVMNIRRAVGNKPYIVLLVEDTPQVEAIQAGANDVLHKPVSNEALDVTLENAERLNALTARLGDDSEDFPSAGGVIAKSAFNQLFLSGIDRANRYGEFSYVLFITMSNYQDILEMDGKTAADFAMAKLSQHLVHLRRQSDIIGQTEQFEYALFLLPSPVDNEALEATKRFVQSLEELEDIASSGAQEVQIRAVLLNLPSAKKITEYNLVPGVEQKRQAGT